MFTPSTANLARRACWNGLAPDPEKQHDSYKRKLALVVSFVGSNYYGMQYQPLTDATHKSVEGVLRQALYDIGAILPSNDFSRINWSRSSRTDKGVHAARLVCSAKLEIQASWLPKFDVPEDQVVEAHRTYLEHENVRLKALVEALNSRLPDDIRAISCVKVNSSFMARNACDWREYEYVIPVSILTHPVITPPVLHEGAALLPPLERYHGFDPSTQTSEEALTRLNEALSQYLGAQNFHNFHNLKGKAIREILGGKDKKGKGRDTWAKKNDPEASLEGDADDFEELEEDGAIDGVDASIPANVDQKQGSAPSASAAISGGGGSVGKPAPEPWVNYLDHWKPEDRLIAAKFRIRIYAAEGRLVRTPNGQEMVSITVRGSGFLLK